MNVSSMYNNVWFALFFNEMILRDPSKVFIYRLSYCGTWLFHDQITVLRCHDNACYPLKKDSVSVFHTKTSFPFNCQNWIVCFHYGKKVNFDVFKKLLFRVKKNKTYNLIVVMYSIPLYYDVYILVSLIHICYCHMKTWIISLIHLVTSCWYHDVYIQATQVISFLRDPGYKKSFKSSTWVVREWLHSHNLKNAESATFFILQFSLHEKPLQSKRCAYLKGAKYAYENLLLFVCFLL